MFIYNNIISIIRIQLWWKKICNKKSLLIIQNYVKSIPKDKISYEDLKLHIKDGIVLNVTNKCIKRIQLLLTLLYKKPSYSNKINVHDFLSAYIIVNYRSRIFETVELLEQKLYTYAERLLNTFENICLHFLNVKCIKKIDLELTKPFNKILYNYIVTFQTWSKSNNIKYIENMEKTLIKLYDGEKSISLDDPHYESIKKEFIVQITIIRDKLIKHGGKKRYEEFEFKYKNGIEVVLPTKDFCNNFKSPMTNEAMAHELLINPNFKIHSLIFKFLKTDIIHELSSEPPCYTKTLDFLKNIKDMVDESILTDNIINEQCIQLLINTNNFNMYLLKNILIKMFNKLILYLDDNKKIISDWKLIIKKYDELALPIITCDALELLMNLVNTLCVHNFNMKIDQFKPVIQVHGIKYEYYKFAGKLNSGVITLDKTRKIFRKSIKVHELELIVQSYDQIYINFIVNIISDPNIITFDNCPETLLLDISRLNKLREDFNILCISKCIIYELHNYLVTHKLDFDIYDTLIHYIFENFDDLHIDNLLTNIKDIIKISDLNKVLLSCFNIKDTKYKLSSKQLASVYCRLLEGQSISEETPFMSKIVDAVKMLSTIIKINREVHDHIYKKILTGIS